MKVRSAHEAALQTKPEPDMTKARLLSTWDVRAWFGLGFVISAWLGIGQVAVVSIVFFSTSGGQQAQTYGGRYNILGLGFIGFHSRGSEAARAVRFTF